MTCSTAPLLKVVVVLKTTIEYGIRYVDINSFDFNVPLQTKGGIFCSVCPVLIRHLNSHLFRVAGSSKTQLAFFNYPSTQLQNASFQIEINMSSEGAYSRYSAPGSRNPYGQSYSTSGTAGYGGGSAYGSGYGAGPAPTYGGASYSTSYTPASSAGASYGQVRRFVFQKWSFFPSLFRSCQVVIFSDSVNRIPSKFLWLRENVYR